MDRHYEVWQWAKSADTATSLFAYDAKGAAEAAAGADVNDDGAWPRSYSVRDLTTGIVCIVDVDRIIRPAFAAFAVREVTMSFATHVLWGARVLCEDLRLMRPADQWPTNQRWISLADIRHGAEQPDDACAMCWKKVPGLITGLKLIGARK